jgi:Uma2 family endonuclease
MTYLLVTPEQEIFPNRKRWTRQECARLIENGELEGRYELIDGEILSKMGQNPPHRITVILIVNWLAQVFGNLFIQTQDPMHIRGMYSDHNEPEPDIAVTLRPTTEYNEGHPEAEDLIVVVEVADSSLRFDLTTKALLYARAGVRDYWVADIAGRRITVHRNPAEAGYTDVRVYAEEETVSLLLRPDAASSVEKLLPPVK